MHGEFPVGKVLEELKGNDLLPAILFRSSRKQCDVDVERALDRKEYSLTQQESKELHKTILEVAEKYSIEERLLVQHPHYGALITTGIGAHHAGQLLIWRLLLEELMTKGMLRIMIATGTVAAGVDFPARTVVVTAHSKRGAEGFQVLTPSELQQMSGRAGRRGKDTVGICLAAPGPYCDARVIQKVSKEPPEPLRSCYYASPSTVLNLLKHRHVEDLRFTVERSLAAFLDRRAAGKLVDDAEKLEGELEQMENKESQKYKKGVKRARRKRREADTLTGKQLNLLDLSLEGLEKLGYVEDSALTKKGGWAAELCTSLVLELGEAIDSYVFYDLTLEELMGVVASIAGDSYRTYLSIRKNPVKKELFTKMEEVVARVANSYEGSPFASEIRVQEDAAVTVLTWLEAENWFEFAGLLRLSGVTEGDATRLISQTADHLHQISRLSETHPDLAELAKQGRSLLLVPPVSDAYERVIAEMD